MQTTPDITEQLHAISGGATPPVDLVVNDRTAALAVFTQARSDANGVINPYGYHLKTVLRPR
jgi:hypothetical protein